MNQELNTMASDSICRMPDSVLLNVLCYLSLEDLLNVAKSCTRLESLCWDRTVVRCVHVEGQYSVKEEDLKQIIGSGSKHVKCLNLNHCYWFSQRTIHWAISKCPNLLSLRVTECKLKTEALVTLIASCTQLQELFFSISSFANVKRDVFTAAKPILAQVKKLGVYYSSRELAVLNYVGEHATLLDYCLSLEELYIGSAGMAIPELYRPIVSRPLQLTSLKVMCITSNIHAGAQMMFYGTLSQLPNANISWRTLLMPNVNLMEFLTKPEFRGCLTKMRSMKHLDVSGSKISFPCDALDMTTARSLTHLNISMTLMKCEQLKIVATSCNHLASLNLFGCGHIFQGREGLDFSGLEAVFENCPDLRHLNLAGAHHHLFMLPEGDQGVIRRVFGKMKGLQTLALPMCMLAETDQSHTRAGKRLASSSPKSHTYAAKRRCVDLGSQNYAESSGDSSPTTSSASPTRASPTFSRSPVLHEMLRDNQDIEELELIAVNFTSAIHKNKYIIPKTQQFGPCMETRRVRDVALEPISHLKRLRRLVIVGAPGLVSGQSLVSISKECHQLTSLHMGYLGGAMYGNIFSQALVYMKNLTDLRLEQPHLCLNSSLFEGLRHCDHLTRLCLIAKHSTFNATDVIRLVEQLLRLVVIQLFAGGTITQCKNLSTTLHRRFGRQRPALNSAIYPCVYDGISDVTKSIPAKHFDELTRFQTRVCSLPECI